MECRVRGRSLSALRPRAQNRLSSHFRDEVPAGAHVLGFSVSRALGLVLSRSRRGRLLGFGRNHREVGPQGVEVLVDRNGVEVAEEDPANARESELMA